jgi:tetratricopeptide (TPR) repeat protein
MNQSIDLPPLFRKVVLGAAEASLDVAGTMVLPGAWPILKGALQPVLDRLKERLGGDVTTSRKRAEEAVAAFEADPHLQEVLRSNLLEQLEPHIQAFFQGQQKLDADVQKLMLIVTVNQELLDDLVGGVERIEQHIEEGVKLSDESVRELTHAVARQVESSRRVRALALREMGPVGQLIERQVHRLQVRAVELIEEGALDRATDEVQEGLLLISALLSEAPTDIKLQLQLGFLYKTISQVFDAAGEAGEAQTYIQRAEEVFRFVREEVAGDQKTALDVANAIHGLGNVDHQRGHFQGAIEKYQLATSLYPDHMYAWHDIFAANYELARRGQVNLEVMLHALERLKQTGKGAPGLGTQHIARLEGVLRELEKNAAPPTAQRIEETHQTADDVAIRIIPRFLSLVIAESDPYIAVFNINCDIVNESSARASVRKLEAALITPEGLQLRFAWNVFYDFRPSNLLESSRMTKTSDAHEIEVEAGASRSLGIQFLGPALEPHHLWTPGEYEFELYGWVNRQPGHDRFDLKTKFKAEIHDSETIQVKYWSGATSSQWDQLQDPDRAVGIPVRIDEHSIIAT